MKDEYLSAAVATAQALAKERGEKFDVRLFITGAAKRAAQLARGYRRFIPLKPGDQTPLMDIALQEIAAGKILIKQGEVSAADNANVIEIASISEV